MNALSRIIGVLMLTLLASLAGPSVAGALPPSVEGESISGLTSTGATLEAQINPQSTERGVRYQFQVVSEANEYRAEFTCPTEGFPAGTSLCLTLPSQAGALPIGVTAAGIQGQTASVDLANAGMSLQPGTTYHYRVIAARNVPTVDTIVWEAPMVAGSDETFTTPLSTLTDEGTGDIAPPPEPPVPGTPGGETTSHPPGSRRATTSPRHRHHHRRHAHHRRHRQALHRGLSPLS